MANPYATWTKDVRPSAQAAWTQTRARAAYIGLDYAIEALESIMDPDAADGFLLLADGAEATPSVSNAGDPNTGMWFPAADEVAWSVGGSEAVRIDSSGNVGIGTASPEDRFHVVGAAGVTGAITNQSSTQFILENAGDLTLAFNTPNTAFAQISNEDPDGNQRQYITMDHGTSANGVADSIGFGTAGVGGRLLIDSVGNIGVATYTFGSGAQGVFGIANAGAAPSSSPANMVQLYAEDVSASSELKVRDEAGNITVLSPHDFSLLDGPSEDMAWAYYSERNGRAINVDMLKVVRAVERLTGQSLVTINQTEKL